MVVVVATVVVGVMIGIVARNRHIGGSSDGKWCLVVAVVVAVVGDIGRISGCSSGSTGGSGSRWESKKW